MLIWPSPFGALSTPDENSSLPSLTFGTFLIISYFLRRDAVLSDTFAATPFIGRGLCRKRVFNKRYDYFVSFGELWLLPNETLVTAVGAKGTLSFEGLINSSPDLSTFMRYSEQYLV